MSKHIAQHFFYQLPSGAAVHPCRLIQKDGTLMWKHACQAALPLTEAHEQHIIKTAQRLEELNSWVSQGLDPWQCLTPVIWYYPNDPELNEGISVYFKHSESRTHPSYTSRELYDRLLRHIQSHETLELRQDYLFFKRC